MRAAKEGRALVVHYRTMKSVTAHQALLLALLATTMWSCSRDPAEQADLVVVGGTVLTVDADFTVAEALAVRDGRILAVGSEADIRNLIGPDTEVIEMAG